MNDINEQLEELKLALSVPRVYLTAYFDKLRNEIDTACELFVQVQTAEKAVVKQLLYIIV